MSAKTQKFSTQSSNFWVNVANVLLSVVAMAGVNLPADPATITGDFSTTLSSTGWIAAVGILAINVISPIYHAFLKGSFSLNGVFSSSNFWIQVGSLAASALVLVGLAFPAGTVEEIVGAVYAKDWSALLVILFSNVLNPLIRFFKDRFTATASA